jgi:hypothetical protein
MANVEAYIIYDTKLKNIIETFILIYKKLRLTVF